MVTKVAENVYWAGAVDWEVRNFHGHTYHTHRGTTYNAYLIVDDKIALVDTVMPEFEDEMFRHIAEVVDPARIDYLIANHGELDHSGAIPAVLARAPQATLVHSKRGEDSFGKYFQDGWKRQIVGSGDTIQLGHKTLAFLEAPMLHWPDSMFTYIPEDRLLLPNDAFGQHLASAKRFADEVDQGVLWDEARKYFGNILVPFSKLILRKVEEVQQMGLEIDVIAPQPRRHLARESVADRRAVCELVQGRDAPAGSRGLRDDVGKHRRDRPRHCGGDRRDRRGGAALRGAADRPHDGGGRPAGGQGHRRGVGHPQPPPAVEHLRVGRGFDRAQAGEQDRGGLRLPRLGRRGGAGVGERPQGGRDRDRRRWAGPGLAAHAGGAGAGGGVWADFWREGVGGSKLAKTPRTAEMTYDLLHAAIDALDPVGICVTKSQVAFRRSKAFAWAWMPCCWNGRTCIGSVLSPARRPRRAGKACQLKLPNRRNYHEAIVWRDDSILAYLVRRFRILLPGIYAHRPDRS
jgi:glyoxylase-like metal-dependent hydrolase (beta-lactamase superfamily II)